MIRQIVGSLKPPRSLMDRARRLAGLVSRGRDLVLVTTILPYISSFVAAPSPVKQYIQRVTWTSTGLAVIAIGPLRQPPSVIVKIPHTPEGIASLQRQRQVQATLRADARLGDWCLLVSQPLGQGEIASKFYVIERALRGRAIPLQRASQAEIAWLQCRAAAVIGHLHRSTAVSVVIDSAILRKWVDEPLQIIRNTNATLPRASRSDEAIERLRMELSVILLGRSLRVGWIHGDFWLGNILVDRAGTEIVGILDWDRAVPEESPLHDILHMLLHMRAVQRERDLGDIVREFLRGDKWTDHERSLLNATEVTLLEDAPLQRAMVLLYWLRNRAATLTLLPNYGNDPVWVAQNIVGVLQSI